MLQIGITFAYMLAPLNLLPSMKQQNRKQHENKTRNTKPNARSHDIT
jgi:hypothetical protein